MSDIFRTVASEKTFLLLVATVLVSGTKWLVERQKRLESQNDYMPKLLTTLETIQQTQEKLVTRIELNEIRNERVFAAILNKLDNRENPSDNSTIWKMINSGG